ncbi:MAG: DUF6178 family protein [Thermodesulfobacteriota bacterium]
MDQPNADQAESLIRSFANLPAEKQLAIFRDLSSRARAELLAAIPHPVSIISRIAEEEAYVAIKEAGEEAALPLIALTTGKQLVYLLDIELWKKEELDMESAGRWFELLTRIGDAKVLQFVQVSDPELLLTAVSRFIKVQTRDPDLDMVEQRDSLPVFTLDDTFFIEFVSSRWEGPVRSLLQTIYEWNPSYYFGMMEELCWGISEENEQAALHWRRARLADHGFPEFDEAFEIYKYLHRDGVCEGAEPVDEGGLFDESGSHMLLRYPMRLLRDESLFRECLDQIRDDAEKDRLAVQLAHLANKVMIADNLDPGSVDDLQRSLRKVGGYVNIALEEACAGDLPRARDLIRSNHMEMLFRRGYSLVLDLRREGSDLLKSMDTTVEEVGHPLSGLLKGLFHRRPYFAAGYLGPGRSREFASWSDIQAVRAIIRSAEAEEGWEPI